MKEFDELRQTVHRLRAPGGCPWDRKQTHQSLRPFMLEEACEMMDAIDGPTEAFQAELGDVLMQVVLHSEIAEETRAFDVRDVIQGLNDKLIRRHPHVFGDASAENADQALQTWNEQKKKEKQLKGEDVRLLDRIPKSMPSLERSTRVIEEVSKVGFQWPSATESFAKVREEFEELEEALVDLKTKPEAVAHEIGDMIFALCNLSYLCGQNPADSLKSMLSRFETRFRHVECEVERSGKSWQDHSLNELDVFWNEAKKK